MGDTTKGSRRTLAATAAVVAALLATAALLGCASAEPTRIPAQVVWAQGERVYVASTDSLAPDSLALKEGDLLTLLLGKRVVASGVVVNVYDPVFVVARLSSGSLARVKKLERLRILAERKPVPMLRIGWPGTGRPCVLFPCGQLAPRPPTSTAYRSETLGPHSYQLVRLPGDSSKSPWPDTLSIHLFDDLADQEIALERGELDVAILWPGELSMRMDDHMRWRVLHGTRSRGALAALPARGELSGELLSAADSAAVIFLNEIVFQDDLTPWSRSVEGASRLKDLAASDARGSRRFEVDRYCPGWQDLERFLNMGKKIHPAAGEPAPLQLTYLDVPVDSPDSLALAIAGYSHGTFGKGSVPFANDGPPVTSTFLFAIRCPIVCTPKLRAYVHALGPDALVDMLDCRPAK